MNLEQIVKRAEREIEGKWTKEELLDVLPHGSGIDADWRVYRDNAEPDGTISIMDVFVCVNSYHAMDEYGGYVGWLDFSLTIPVEKSKYEMMVIEFDECKEYLEDMELDGVYVDGILEYLEDTIYWSIRDYVEGNK